MTNQKSLSTRPDTKADLNTAYLKHLKSDECKKHIKFSDWFAMIAKKLAGRK